MNYQKIYDSLVQKNHTFLDGEYFEIHHKVPRCMGGTDDASNLVNLSAREHYIAHLLLVKITQNTQAYGKMLYAFNCMKWGRCDGERSFKYNSRLYQKLKERFSKMRSENMKSLDNPHLGKIWIYSVLLRQNKQWDKNEPLPDGWSIGRIINWDKYFDHVHRKEMKELKLKEKIEQLNQMYQDYLKFGITYVRKKYNYDKSEENLTISFKRYVSAYDVNALRKAAKTRHVHQVYTKSSEEERIKYFTSMYEFYQKHGYEETEKEYKWSGSRNTLRWNFRRYVKNRLHEGKDVI